MFIGLVACKRRSFLPALIAAENDGCPAVATRSTVAI